MENLDQLSSLLAPILNDPEAMENISQAAAQLGFGDILGGSASVSESAETAFGSTENSGKKNDAGDQHSPDTNDLIAKLLPLLSGNDKQNDSSRLLSALRPFLHGERAKRLEDAERIVKLMSVMSTLRQQGLL